MGISDDDWETLTPILQHAALYLTVDAAICFSPVRGAVIRWFGLDGPGQAGKARRTVSQFAMRAVGMLFLVLMFPRCFRILASTELRQNAIRGWDANSLACMSLTAGYFLYDLVICVCRFHAAGGLPFFVHAVIALCAFGYACHTHCLHYIGGCVLLWEASTPLLYFRWLLLKTGHAHSRLLPATNMAFMAVFFAVRCAWGPMVLRSFYLGVQRDRLELPGAGMSGTVATLFWIGCSTMTGLNFYWFGCMVRAALLTPADKTKEA